MYKVLGSIPSTKKDKKKKKVFQAESGSGAGIPGVFENMKRGWWRE
jgi:hypothetical protein